MKQTNHARTIRIMIYVLLMIPFLFSSLAGGFTTSAQDEEDASRTTDGLVYVVKVQEVVERGLAAYMNRAFDEAIEAGADHIVLDINTPGGAVLAAQDIGDLIQEYRSFIPITAFVNSSATSAGAYIALTADNIVMTPSGSMGSATVVDIEGNAGDAKALAFWISRMVGAAEVNDRDPLYAEAMVDPGIVIEDLTPEGRPLDFTANQALENGYAEAIASNMQEVLEFIELGDAEIVEVELAFSENLARLITNPIVASIMLSLAGLGLVLELYSPGFGIAGSIGLASLLLFFFGHLIAGFAGLEAVILFVVGVGLIVFEVFVPGLGIFGILGLAAIISSLVLASENVLQGLSNIGIALLITLVVAAILARAMNKRGMWSRLVLQEGLATAEGEVLYTEKETLVGLRGQAATTLRPSGTAIIDGRRFDVVANGGYIARDQSIVVENVEGPRIMVRAIEDGQDNE